MKKKRELYLNSENITVNCGRLTNQLKAILYNSLFKDYQENVTAKMKGIDFVFCYIDSLYLNFHEVITLNHGDSYINSKKCLKKKKHQFL